MGASFIETLYAVGDALSGAFMRVIGGRKSDGTAQAFATDFRGSMFVDVTDHLSDPFNRFRGSTPTGIWDAKQNFDNSPNFYGTTLVGGGTAPYTANRASTAMTLTTTSGDSVVRQSLQYVPYQPGRGQLIFMTAIMGVIKTNVRQRVGYFDTNNGVFFEQDGTNLKVVRRTFVTGSAVDTAVNQSAWNVDKLDGTGISGVTLDNTKVQVFVIDFTWLGAGTIRFGFLINGEIHYCHKIEASNALTAVWATTAALPVRWEITNTGTAASGTVLEQICACVISEGGSDPLGVTAAASTFPIANAGITIASRTAQTTQSIRLKAAYVRGLIKPIDFQVVCTTADDFLVEIYIGGTLSGGSPTTTSISDAVEMITGNTTLTGGRRIAVALSSNQVRISAEAINSLRGISASDNAGTQELLTVIVTPLGPNAATFYSGLTWREIY
jgi:hypothetical protein